jgi:hypothetical protein
MSASVVFVAAVSAAIFGAVAMHDDGSRKHEH